MVARVGQSSSWPQATRGSAAWISMARLRCEGAKRVQRNGDPVEGGLGVRMAKTWGARQVDPRKQAGVWGKPISDPPPTAEIIGVENSATGSPGVGPAG